MMSNWAIWLLEGNGKKQNSTVTLATLHTVCQMQERHGILKQLSKPKTTACNLKSYFGPYYNKSKHTIGLKLETVYRQILSSFIKWGRRINALNNQGMHQHYWCVHRRLITTLGKKVEQQFYCPPKLKKRKIKITHDQDNQERPNKKHKQIII